VRPARSLLFLLFVALALRLGLLVFTQTTPLVVSDERDYVALAESILDRGEFAFEPGRPTSMRPPLYPAFLAGVFAVAGAGNLQAVRFAQVVVSLALIVVVYRLGTRMYDGRIGLVAAGVVGFYPSLLLANYLLLTELLFTLFVLLGCLALVRLLDGGSKAALWATVTGLSVGLAALTRSVLWPFPLVLVPFAGLVVGGSARRRIGLAAVVLAGYAVVVVPWAARNTRLQGVVTIVDTMGGMNLRVGNYEHTPDDRMWSAPFSYNDERLWSLGIGKRGDDWRHWTDGQKEKRAQRKALEYMVAHPGTTLRRSAIRFADFWGLEREFVALVRDGKYHPPGWFVAIGALAITVSFAAVALLAIVGIFGAPPHDLRVHAFSLLLILFICGVHSLVFAHSRYRLPLTPLLAIYASAALVIRPSWTSTPRTARVASASACVLLVVIWIRQLMLSDASRVRDLLKALWP